MVPIDVHQHLAKILIETAVDIIMFLWLPFVFV